MLDGACVCPSWVAWSPGAAPDDCPRHGSSVPQAIDLARNVVALAEALAAAEARAVAAERARDAMGHRERETANECAMLRARWAAKEVG